MRRTNDLCYTVVCHLRNLVGGIFREPRVRGDDSDGSVAKGVGSDKAADGITRPREDLLGLWIDHIAKGVDYNDRSNHGAIIHTEAGRAKPAFHHKAGSKEFANSCPSSCSHIALCYGFSCSLFAGAVTCCRVGTNAGGSKTEVENGCCRYDRYARNSDVDANIVCFKIVRDAAS